jgi:hypothetical protein
MVRMGRRPPSCVRWRPSRSQIRRQKNHNSGCQADLRLVDHGAVKDVGLCSAAVVSAKGGPQGVLL